MAIENGEAISGTGVGRGGNGSCYMVMNGKGWMQGTNLDKICYREPSTTTIFTSGGEDHTGPQVNGWHPSLYSEIRIKL
jgi:hypothetical protein